MKEARVLDLSPAPPLEVDIVPSLAAEFLMSLMAFASSTPKEVDVGREWFRRIRSWCSRDLLDDLSLLGRANKLWSNLVGLLWDRRMIEEPAALIRLIERADASDLRVMLVSHHAAGANDQMGERSFRAALHGDRRAQRRLLKLVQSSDETGSSSWLLPYLELGVVETKELAVRILRRWSAEVFQRMTEFVCPILLCDAKRMRAAAAGRSPAEVIFEATNGVSYAPTMPVRRVVLTPQIAMRPWNIVRAYPNFLFICYPVASDCLALEDSGPPDHLLRLHRALGDERRLEILKLLARSDTSLDELSKELGIAKSSVLYHMGLLRSAGLVRIESDYRSRYGLRWETAAAAGSALRQFLGDPPS